jgi:Stress responsive A/B Barrel Domain
MHFIKWVSHGFSLLRDLQECFLIYVIYHVSLGRQDAGTLHEWPGAAHAAHLWSSCMSDPVSAPSAIRHIVMWNVAGETPEERATAIEAVRNAFEALRGRIPGLTRLEIGIDHSRIDYACDMVLLTDFDSEASLRAYATHPLHLAARDRLQGLRIARHQVDYRLNSVDAA